MQAKFVYSSRIWVIFLAVAVKYGRVRGVMKLRISPRRAAGFTLIELMVVIAIMVTLASIAGTAIYSHMGAGDEAKCRAQLEQLHPHVARRCVRDLPQR